jgi:hypothetical protein
MSFGRTYAATGAYAIKEKLVTGNAKPARKLRFELRDTSLKLIEPVASIALEMMMMLLPGHLVPR